MELDDRRIVGIRLMSPRYLNSHGILYTPSRSSDRTEERAGLTLGDEHGELHG